MVIHFGKTQQALPELFAWIGQVLLVAFTYWIVAQFSLLFSLGFGISAASPFWPPSGIALYILLSRGRNLWPGIAIGHLLAAQLSSYAPDLVISIGVAFSAAGEAVLSQYLLQRINGPKLKLDESMKALISLIGIGILLSPLVFATLTVAISTLASTENPNSQFIAWRTFFLGNALGVMVFTPLLLAVQEFRASAMKKMDGLEAFALFGSSVVASILIFSQPRPLLFLISPLLCWAALRFRTLGISLVMFVTSLIGYWFTSVQSGPLGSLELSSSFALLQVYLGAMGITGLFLTTGAQSEGRRRALIETATERKKFEIAARNASDLIYEWTPERGVFRWWGRIDEALGYKPGEFPHTTEAWRSHIHPDDYPRVMTAVQQSLTYHTPRHQEYRMVKKDGSIAVWRVSGQYFGEDPSGDDKWIGVISDITEQRRYEEALRRSEERYQLATSAAEIGVWDWDPNQNETTWSSGVAHLFGTNKRDLTTDEVFELVHPEDRKALRDLLEGAIQEKRINYTCEFRVIWPNGSTHWLLGRGKLFYDETGHVLRAMGTTQDITDSKKLMNDLCQAREAAEAASRAKMEFLANMSHEIRTPMNAILGFANLLSEPNLTEEFKTDFIEKIKANGDQLLALVNDILDLSKYEAGHMPVESLQFSLPDLVAQTLQVLRPLAENKNLSLECRLLTPIPQVITSDPVRLRQILTNLIGNAIKFTDKGFVKLHIGFIAPTTPSPTASPAPARLRIDVEDTGIGISGEARDRLFRPFSQADISVARKYGGTGLGLTLSKRLAQALHGDLILTRSQPGRGSCFTFWIEIGDVSRALFIQDLKNHTAPLKPAAPARPPKVHHLENLRILLAEDSPDSEALVRHYLKMEGADATSAHNGLEALQMAQAGNFDAILMDVQMPGMDGLEATRQLRALGFRKPIIALTAYALQSEVQKSMDAGCTAHLTKPISRDRLVETLLATTNDLAPEGVHGV